MNLIIKSQYVMLYSVISTLGYCSTPIVLLSIGNLFMGMKNILGLLLIGLISILSTFLAVRFLGAVTLLGF
jgi:hypothetical protein